MSCYDSPRQTGRLLIRVQPDCRIQRPEFRPESPDATTTGATSYITVAESTPLGAEWHRSPVPSPGPATRAGTATTGVLLADGVLIDVCPAKKGLFHV